MTFAAMMPGTRPASRILFRDATAHGVDFSGGRKHRRKIWISSWREGEEAGARRGFSHDQLVEEIATSAADGRRHLWLVDSTFGLPREMLRLHGIEESWRAGAEWLASFGSAREWRRAARRRSRKELKRTTDHAAVTPFAPSNLRMFRQTWHSIVSVLLPLSTRSGVAIVPIASVRGDAGAVERRAWSEAPVWVAEGCPSATLRDRGWPHRGYKGSSPQNRTLREVLVDRLRREEGLGISEEAARAAVEDEEGDALDSLLLLPAARRLGRVDPEDILAREPAAAVEGWVFT